MISMRPHRIVIVPVFAAALVASPTDLRAQDVPLSQVLVPGEEWQLVGAGYRSLEGAAADRQGAVYFADKAANTIYRVDPAGTVGIFAEGTGGANALMFGPDDRLYVTQPTARRIVAYALDGRSEIVAADVEADDLVVAGDGSIWFSDAAGGRIGYISPDRTTTLYVQDGLRPAGLTLAHREGTLVVADAEQPYLWAFRIELDGSLTAPAPAFGPLRIPFGEIVPGSGGMTVDTRDRVFVTSTAGLQMFDTEDRFSGVIASPLREKKITSATFGGEDFAYLYVTLDDQIHRLRTATTGIPYFARDYARIGGRVGGAGGGGEGGRGGESKPYD
jgi:gluconolactonase